MDTIFHPQTTRPRLKDRPAAETMDVADVYIFSNPQVRMAEAKQLALAGEVPAMQTLWKPTPEEITKLVAGGHLVLTVVGRVHPLVSLEVSA